MFELLQAWKGGYYGFPYTKNNCMLMYPLPSLSCGERGLSGSRTLSQAGRLQKIHWGTLSIIEIWWQLEESNLSGKPPGQRSVLKRDFLEGFCLSLLPREAPAPLFSSPGAVPLPCPKWHRQSHHIPLHFLCCWCAEDAFFSQGRQLSS